MLILDEVSCPRVNPVQATRPNHWAASGEQAPKQLIRAPPTSYSQASSGAELPRRKIRRCSNDSSFRDYQARNFDPAAKATFALPVDGNRNPVPYY